MRLSFLKRDLPKRAMISVLALVAVAGVVTGREKPAMELIEAKAPARAEAPAQAELDIDLEKLQRADGSLPQNDPFARASFGQPERRHAAAAPHKPEVPPLPFQYIGKVIEKGTQEVYLMRGDELVSIAAGQKIGADYRVDRITDKAISFTYLPLKTKQTLDLPAVNQ